MSTSGGPVRAVTVHVAESAQGTVVPAACDPIGGMTRGGGTRRTGVAGWSGGVVEATDPSREFPEVLVAGAARGDERARDELLALIHPLALRYCRAKLGRQESLLCSADDVAQDVCVAVLGALRSYQPSGLSFRAFVLGIAAHKVVDAFRACGRDRTEPMAEVPDGSVRTDSPEDLVLAAERTERLRALSAHLTPRQREVLVLRVAVGLSAEEAAQTVGSTTGAVRVTQHRALARLRRLILQGEAAAQRDIDSAVHT
jgi:RNA polymerase sigma-70 factor (ECF subfamily)